MQQSPLKGRLQRLSVSIHRLHARTMSRNVVLRPNRNVLMSILPASPNTDQLRSFVLAALGVTTLHAPLLACDAGGELRDGTGAQRLGRLTGTSSPVGAASPRSDKCPFGWTLVEGGETGELLQATAWQTCVRAGDGADTVNTLHGVALFAYGGEGNDDLHGANRRDGIHGGPGHDRITGGEMSDFLDGGRGNDKLEGGDGPDLLFGGDGNDDVFGDEGPDQLWLGEGRDNGNGGAGNDVVYGGPGDDVAAGDEGDDSLHGGPGHDALFGDKGSDHLGGGLGNDKLDGGPGGDVLHGGPGRDEVYGGEGDDVVRIASPCEVQGGEIIDGGPGFDTLFSHQSEAELAQAGVRVLNIEKFIQLKTHPNDTVCIFEREDDGYAEVIVTVAHEETFWRDDYHDFALDGSNHFLNRGASLARHLALSVESVLSTTGAPVVDGDEIFLYRAGGSASFSDGTGLDLQACCEPEPIVGRRYRMALRWDREKDEYRFLYDAIGGGGDIPLAPLPLFGTLPFVSDAPLVQSPGPFCPLAPEHGTFGSAEESVAWAMNVENNVGRWAQDISGETYNPDWVDGNVAKPILSAHSSTENVCDTGHNEQYLQYIRAGVISWNDSPWLGHLIGVVLPGMPQNPVLGSPCTAGALVADDENHQGDGKNCIAIAGEPDSNGNFDIHELEESSTWNSTPNIAGLNARWRTDPPEDEDWAGAHQVMESDTILQNNDIRHWDECEGGGGGGSIIEAVTHEFGHFLGMRHSDCVADVMFGGYPPAGFPSPQDHARAQILYPSPDDGLVFPENIYVQD